MQTQVLTSETFTQDLSNLVNTLTNSGMNNGFGSMKERIQDAFQELFVSDGFAQLPKEVKRAELQGYREILTVLEELQGFCQKYEGEMDLQQAKGLLRIYSQQPPQQVETVAP
jgi:hypothetical protein